MGRFKLLFIIFGLLMALGYAIDSKADDQWPGSACGGTYGSPNPDDPNGPTKYSEYKSECPPDPALMADCTANTDRYCWVETYKDVFGKDTNSNGIYDWGYGERIMWNWTGCPAGTVETPEGGECAADPDYCELKQYTHENSLNTECGSCNLSGGWIPTTGSYMPDSGSPFALPYDCGLNKEPGECAMDGKSEVITDQGAYCVPQCVQGSLDGKCLQEPEPDVECGPDHPDFKGVIGYGGEAALVCGDAENQCPTGSSYGFAEQADGSYKASCFPPESNPPQCPGGSAVIMGGDSISFQCGEIRNPDATPDDLHDAMNGDSDGDGQGDITGITNQLGEIQKLLKKGNNNTDNINETLKGIGKKVTEGTKAITDAIGNIPGGGGGDTGNGKTEIVGEDGEAITWSGAPIDTALTDPTDDYDQVMADYQAKINQIKSEVQAMFSTNLTGGGSVDDNTKTIMGVDVNFSLNRFLGGLDILGAIVLFCAAFISAGILFTGRG